MRPTGGAAKLEGAATCQQATPGTARDAPQRLATADHCSLVSRASRSAPVPGRLPLRPGVAVRADATFGRRDHRRDRIAPLRRVVVSFKMKKEVFALVGAAALFFSPQLARASCVDVTPGSRPGLGSSTAERAELYPGALGVVSFSAPAGGVWRLPGVDQEATSTHVRRGEDLVVLEVVDESSDGVVAVRVPADATVGEPFGFWYADLLNHDLTVTAPAPQPAWVLANEPKVVPDDLVARQGGEPCMSPLVLSPFILADWVASRLRPLERYEGKAVLLSFRREGSSAPWPIDRDLASGYLIDVWYSSLTGDGPDLDLDARVIKGVTPAYFATSTTEFALHANDEGAHELAVVAVDVQTGSRSSPVRVQITNRPPAVVGFCSCASSPRASGLGGGLVLSVLLGLIRAGRRRR